MNQAILTKMENRMRKSLENEPMNLPYVRKDWLVHRGKNHARILRGIRRLNVYSGDVSYTFQKLNIRLR